MAGHSAIMSVRITGNANDAVKAFEKATGKAAAFGSFMGGAALKGVTALWDKLKNFSGAVVEMSDSTDKFKNTMSFAGLDTSAVEAATKATRKYADDTVYDLTTIQNTTAQLAANGITNYTELTEAAGNLNAVAGGNSDTFKSVAMMLTQTAGAGKLTTENWNQLADAIPGASGKLQEAMLANGAYTGNFRDAMAKGEITAAEFNQALIQLGMSDVAKEAATSTKTIEGAMGNLEASVVGGLTDAFDLVKPAVTSAMGVAAEKITAFSGKATTGLKGVITLVRDGNFSAELREAFNIEEDSPITDFLLTVRDTAANTFDTAKTAVTDFMTAFNDTGPVQTASDIFGYVWETCKSLAGAAGDVLAQFAPLTDSFGGASDAGTALGDAFNGAAGIVGDVADKLTAFSDWVSANAEPISAALVGIGTGFAVFKVAGVITAVSSALQGFSIANTAASVAQWALNAAMNANPIVLIITLIAALVAGLVYFFTQTESGRQIWSNFTNFIGACVNNIIGFFQSLPGRIGAFFSSAAQFAQNTWNNVVSWFSGLPGRILSAIGNVGRLLLNAGSSIIEGFLDGLKSAWNNVTGFIGGIADWIAEHKGPAAYDKVLLVKNGRLIMQGLAKGLGLGFDTDVRRAIGNINGRLSNVVFNGGTTAGSQAASTATVFNVTFNAPVDREGVAREIRKILRDYDRKRGN